MRNSQKQEEFNESPVNREKLEKWVKQYFNVDEDLSIFTKRETSLGISDLLEGVVVELFSPDCTKGYILFFGKATTNDITRQEYENKIKIMKKRYPSMSRVMTKDFIDLENSMAGVAWIKVGI